MPSLSEFFLEFPLLIILLLSTDETANMSMPLAAIGTGLSDFVVPVASDIAAKRDMPSYTGIAFTARAGFFSPHGDAETFCFGLNDPP